MTHGGNEHNPVINWSESGIVASNGGSSDPKQEGSDSMRNPDTFTQNQKETRRRKMSRDAQYDRFGDKVKERKVKRPRNNKVKYYDYEQWE